MAKSKPSTSPTLASFLKHSRDRQREIRSVLPTGGAVRSALMYVSAAHELAWDLAIKHKLPKPPARFEIDAVPFDCQEAKEFCVRKLGEYIEWAHDASLTIPKQRPTSPRTQAAATGRPNWVDSRMLIGPCFNKTFAKLLNVARTYLYELIKSGAVWRGPGLTSRKFYWHVRDHSKQVELFRNWESLPPKDRR